MEPPREFTDWEDFDWRRDVHKWAVRWFGIERHHLPESYWKALVRLHTARREAAGVDTFGNQDRARINLLRAYLRGRLTWEQREGYIKEIHRLQTWQADWEQASAAVMGAEMDVRWLAERMDYHDRKRIEALFMEQYGIERGDAA